MASDIKDFSEISYHCLVSKGLLLSVTVVVYVIEINVYRKENSCSYKFHIKGKFI